MIADQTTDLVEYSARLGKHVLAQASDLQRKQYGQFLTPPAVARFMARQLGLIHHGSRILDPAIGSGTLACAVIERVLAEQTVSEIWIEGYEVDAPLAETAVAVLQLASEHAMSRGITIHVCVHAADFILTRVATKQPSLFAGEIDNDSAAEGSYDFVIANPPYFKLRADDPRVAAAAGQLVGHTNIYTLFMALTLKLLAPDGRACFVVPRSFCSGAYFAPFRREFVQRALPRTVHLFDSREDTFKQDAVLQENIILTFQHNPSRNRWTKTSRPICISTSRGNGDLMAGAVARDIPGHLFAGERNQRLFFRLPTGELDETILDSLDHWPGSLREFDWQVSTGPVVAFRATAWLTDAASVFRQTAAPLLWMQNVKRQAIEWPLHNGGKPQAIRLDEHAPSLTVPRANYVLLRRFSAKEEARRLVAAPLLGAGWPTEQLGLENHLNYIYARATSLTPHEAIGLSAILNCSVVDRYFRIVNGNTQVNAEELRALPLPPLAVVRQIGQALENESQAGERSDIDALVTTMLQREGLLPLEFPIIRETRITMGKIQQAQEILKALGLPTAQQNEMSALTLLCLAQLTEEKAWSEARPHRVRIHDILIAIKEHFGREYAENTRETIRRQVIHQFEQAGLIVRNPDDPQLATNSPLTHYALTELAVATMRVFGSDHWPVALQSYFDSRGSLQALYQKTRQHAKVPLRLASGAVYELSPGAHNRLQVEIVQEFGPRFAPGARLLYLGDTANKSLIFDVEGFQQLGVSLSSHDKLPDVVFLDEARNWLFLIEAVVSHGPVSPKRRLELESLFSACPAGRVYVSAFADIVSFRYFVNEIAWDTEVWLAEMPEHLIHFNGDRFLGPRGV